ncbi:gle1 RNA export mediator [Colletes latitarsis]|uniref:gle1 RNA export mediator n=1 Tax=Colletes latitarsis TaxID=2605962 RepID=UPI004035449B
MQNIDDIVSNFNCIKVSALKKASRVLDNQSKIGGITIGPNSTVIENESKKSKNIENEQNICNIKPSQKPSQMENNKISMQSGITFSIKKIFLESEYQRKEEVWKEIERHCQHMKESGEAIKEHMEISRSHMAKERERKSKENYAYILAEEKIVEQEEIRKRLERQMELEEYKKRMKEKEDLTKKIMTFRNTFKTKYYDIIALSENCRDESSVTNVLSSYTVKLQDLHNQMECINEKVKAGDVTSADLNVTEKMVDLIDEILTTFKSEIERINSQYEANLANMESAKQCHVQSEVLQTQTIDNTENNCEVIAPVLTSISDIQNNEDKHEDHLYEYVDKEFLQIYLNSQQCLENYAKSYQELLQSASMKKFRFECQKAINIPVNAISSFDERHLRDKYDRLHNLLIGKSSPNINQHPEGPAFCKDVLAKKIVNQGETLVSSKPKMAFPIAAIIVALWNDHSDFGDLILSHFHIACPFTVPVFLPKMADQSNENYYKSLGYKYNDDGTVEKYEKFVKRMSGLMRLYASITITSQRKGINKTNPHGLQNAWRWLAAVLNIEPQIDVTDLCATLLLDMLEVAGAALWTAYPNQFHKLLILLSEEYCPHMQSVGCIGGGPLVRLNEFLKNSLTKGFIPPPDGQLPPNFW